MPYRSLPGISLKSYLIKSHLYVSLIILTICAFGLFIITTHTFKSYSESSLQLITRSLSEQLEAAIVFDDHQSIKKTLDSFIKEHPLDSIKLMDKNDKVLFTIQQSKTVQSPIIKKIKGWLVSPEIGYHNISHNNQIIAKLYLEYSVEPLLGLLQLFLYIVVTCLFLAWFISKWSTKLIYNSINSSLATLTQKTELISETRNFNEKVPYREIFEFNIITHSFNSLLNEIKIWDSHLQEKNQGLEHLALHDQLTQLPNRAYFYQKLSNIFDQKKPCTLLFIDNDNFKYINDHHGHIIGDMVLYEMAKRLNQTLNNNDFLTRLGGDEFAIILFNISTIEYAIKVAENLLYTTKNPLILENKTEIYFSFSIGIALSENAKTIEDLVHQADQAMYQAKQNNQRKWVVYH